MSSLECTVYSRSALTARLTNQFSCDYLAGKCSETARPFCFQGSEPESAKDCEDSWNFASYPESPLASGWIISDPGGVEIIPIGLNFRPASEAAKRGCAEF